jgi:DNA-binding NtrC family response regulator
MPAAKKKILVVSFDQQLADVRKTVLDEAGFQVLSAADLRAVRKACIEQSPDLVMIGYSLPPAEKRRVWVEVRDLCNCPVLELHQGGAPTLMPPAYFHQAEQPGDFLERVKAILNGTPRRKLSSSRS